MRLSKTAILIYYCTNVSKKWKLLALTDIIIHFNSTSLFHFGTILVIIDFLTIDITNYNHTLPV